MDLNDPPDGAMIMLADFDNLRQIPVAEKLHMIELLWNDIEASGETLPVSDSVRQEVKRRAAEMDADPTLGLTVEELWERVDQIRGK